MFHQAFSKLCTSRHLFGFSKLNITRKMSSESVLVQTKSGPVRGLCKTTIDNLNYVSFQGIPYAQPPIGELRFKVSLCLVKRKP